MIKQLWIGCLGLGFCFLSSLPAYGEANMYRILEFTNGEIIRSPWEFEYENMMDPNLTWLRTTENLDAVVAGSENEFEMIVRLNAWTAQQFEYGLGGPSGPDGVTTLALVHQGLAQGRICGAYNVLFQDACKAFGFHTRDLSIGSDSFIDPQSGKEKTFWHAPTDVWSNDYGKWVYMDATYGFYFELNGIPLSVFELQEAVLKALPAPRTEKRPTKAELFHSMAQAESIRDIRIVFSDYTKKPISNFSFRGGFDYSRIPSPYEARQIMLERIVKFYHVDIVMANNHLSPAWHDSNKEGGCLRVQFIPACASYSLASHLYFEERPNFIKTTDLDALNWTLNDIELDFVQENNCVRDPLILEAYTFTPGIECFLVRLNNGPWTEIKPAEIIGHEAKLNFTWRLKKALNVFEIRTCNQRGSHGPTRKLVVSDSPANVAPHHVGTTRSSVGAGTVIYSPYHQQFVCNEIKGLLIAGKKSINLLDEKGEMIHAPKFTIDAGGFIYAADARRSCIFKFDPAGKLMLAFGNKGSKPGQFLSIGGIAVDAEGNIYVSDAHLATPPEEPRIARIQKFTPQGKFLLSFGQYGIRPGQLNLPSELAISSDHRLYAVDSGNHRIQEFDAKGKCLSQIGPTIEGYGKLKFPSGITLKETPDGKEIYIVDTFNHQILVVNNKGKYLRNFGGYGRNRGDKWVEGGKLLQPRSIAVHQGRLLVYAPPYLHEFREEDGETK